MIDSVDQNSQVQYETSSNHQSQSFWCSLQLKFLIKTCGQLQKLFFPIFVAYDYKRKKCVNNLWSQAFVGQLCNIEDLDLKMAKKAQGLHYVNININIKGREGRRAGLEGLETRREISDLPGPSSKKLGSRVNVRFITPLKNTLTMGGGCGMLEGGRHGAGAEVQGAGEREWSFTDNNPNELIRTYKD